MNKRLRLPDFTTYFDTDDPSPIDFTCRRPPNLFHDLIFLSSYVHDARFKIKDVSVKSRTLRIPLLRDRWELYRSLKNLECIASVLTISPVLSIRWESNGKLLRMRELVRNAEFYIRDVYLGEAYWEDADSGEIVFGSHGERQLRIKVEELFSLSLKDRGLGKK